jgi:hypothetical protein
MKSFQNFIMELHKVHQTIEKLKSQVNTNQQFLSNLTRQFKDMFALKSCMEINLFNPTTLDLISNYYTNFSEWCIFQLNPQNLPIFQFLEKFDPSQTDFTLPLSFCSIPEFLFEDFVEYFKFITHFNEDPIDRDTFNKILSFIVIILRLKT